MTNKVRELGVSSIEEMFDLATYAFNGADTPERRERFRTLAENSWNYGFFDEEDRLTSHHGDPFSSEFLRTRVPNGRHWLCCFLSRSKGTRRDQSDHGKDP